jgi:hypothetical protein
MFARHTMCSVNSISWCMSHLFQVILSIILNGVPVLAAAAFFFQNFVASLFSVFHVWWLHLSSFCLCLALWWNMFITFFCGWMVYRYIAQFTCRMLGTCELQKPRVALQDAVLWWTKQPTPHTWSRWLVYDLFLKILKPHDKLHIRLPKCESA